MHLQFQEITSDEAEAFANWLAGDSWPFFNLISPTKPEITERISQGKYFNNETKNFWILDTNNSKVGLIEIFDLDDLNPWFSIRLKNLYRGKGLGKTSLSWMTEYIFKNYPEIERIEGRTREDNIAMRKTFNKCGYRKEGYFRNALKNEQGQRVASIGYAMIRSEWSSGLPFPVLWEKDNYFAEDII